MKAFTLIFILFCALNSSYGQEEPVKAKPEFARFKIGLLVTPEMGYRILSINSDQPNFYDSYLKYRNEHETPKLGFSAGIAVSYNFSQKVGIEAGFQYTNRGYNYEPTHFDYQEAYYINPGSGKVPVAMRYKYGSDYFELPLRITFTSGRRKLKFVASTGAAAMLLVYNRNTSIVQYADGSEAKKTRRFTYLNQFYIAPQISFGADYQITSRLNFRFEPIARYVFNTSYKTGISTNLISGGLQFSVYFAL
jgi:hypothetical protein